MPLIVSSLLALFTLRRISSVHIPTESRCRPESSAKYVQHSLCRPTSPSNSSLQSRELSVSKSIAQQFRPAFLLKAVELSVCRQIDPFGRGSARRTFAEIPSNKFAKPRDRKEIVQQSSWEVPSNTVVLSEAPSASFKDSSKFRSSKPMNGHSSSIVSFSLLFPLLCASAIASGLPDRLPLPHSIDLPSLESFVAGVWSNFTSLLDSRPGDSRDSIPSLKRYFAQFGYLNLTNPENISTLFDDSTLAALKLYQESFNLSVSGVLDLQTLLQIMTPRCGREDVVDGIPLMLQSTSAKSGTSGIVGHYAFFPSTPKWPASRRNLTYAFSSTNETQKVTLEERRQAFANGFSEWAAVVPINFTETEDFDNADIKIEFVSFAHGDGEPFDGVLGILAHAFSPTDGRFHLDDSEFWSSYTGSEGGPQDIDLQSVVTHEIGHLIGLAHTPVTNAIMYPSIAPRQVKIQLHSDDIHGAQFLYGANPDYNPNNPLPGVPPSLEDVNEAHGPPALSSLSLIVCSILLIMVLQRFW